MAGFMTQFHATLDEIIDLVGQWMKTYPIFATAQHFPPSRLVPMTIENFRDVLLAPDVSQVIFTEGPITKPAKSVYQALDEHPNGLCLNIGRVGATGLCQSTLSTMYTTSMGAKINRELKKATTAGATLLAPDGTTSISRNPRFTAGAKALAASGTPLRQFAQSTDFMYMPK